MHKSCKAILGLLLPGQVFGFRVSGFRVLDFGA